MTLRVHHVLLAISLVALSCGTTGSRADTPPSTTKQILIEGFMFTPVSLAVEAGSSVTWTNKDDEPHTVVSDTALFRSTALDTDETFTFRFDEPGIYHFTCSIHPKMTGTIVVNSRRAE